MKYENVILSGSLQVSGSLVLPSGPTNPSTANAGDLFFNTTSGKAFGYRDEDGWNDLSSMTTYVPKLSNIEYLVVAGGGSGGGWGGGGGAGGMLTGSLSGEYGSGSKFDIVVGAGANYNAYGTSDGDYEQGLNGGSSSLAPNTGTTFTRIDTVGGGGGGDYSGGNATAGSDGGSGGGAAARHPSYSGASGGSGTAGQGNDGGSTASSGNYYPGGGGGGGKGQAGQQGSGNTGGPGGSGSLSTITGTATYYAGGGSGHSPRTDDDPGTPTAPGGGGAGGRYQTAGGSTSQRAAGDGTANTGGGGGGGYGYQSYTVGLGGSGVVILAFSTGTLGAKGGVRKYYNSNGKVAHIFNSSGQFTVEGTKTLTHETLDILGDSSCIALYQFEDNANDTSGNYNGTASNLTYAQGYINNGGVFNGLDSSSRSKITTSNLPTYNNYSISFWMKSDDVVTDADIIMGTSDSYASAVGFGLYTGHPSDGDLTWAVSNGSSRVNITAAGLTAGQWHHVVVTQNISNNEKKIYIDNTLKTTSTSTINNTNVTYSLIIGGYSGYTNSAYDGMLDQIRIFNKALSASEVSTIYNE